MVEGTLAEPGRHGEQAAYLLEGHPFAHRFEGRLKLFNSHEAKLLEHPVPVVGLLDLSENCDGQSDADPEQLPLAKEQQLVPEVGSLGEVQVLAEERGDPLEEKAVAAAGVSELLVHLRTQVQGELPKDLVELFDPAQVQSVEVEERLAQHQVGK